MKIAYNAIFDFGDIAEIEREVGSKIPAFYISSIEPKNLSEMIAVGACRCVVVSHLLTAPDISTATSAIKSGMLCP